MDKSNDYWLKLELVQSSMVFFLVSRNQMRIEPIAGKKHELDVTCFTEKIMNGICPAVKKRSLKPSYLPSLPQSSFYSSDNAKPNED
jgi:hypothetical protein